MNEWPTQHRFLAVVMILLMLGSVAGFLLVARPKFAELEEERAAIRDKRGRLAKTGWPLDVKRLEALLQEMKTRLQGDGEREPEDARDAVCIKSRAALVLRDSTAVFNPKIKKFFGTTEDFMKGVSRLDYQEDFNRLEQALTGRGIVLDEEVLNLGEDKSSLYTYQLVLQVWTLEILTDMVAKHNMTFSQVPVAPKQDGRPAARLTVLPVRAYFLSQEEKEPFVLEFPVGMTLHGQLEDVVEFLRTLQAKDTFLPVSHLELRTDDPGASEYFGKGGRVNVDRVRVELECSAFFRLRDEIPTPRKKTARTGRRGA